MTKPAGFDLRTAPWIPVVDHAGRPAELGIRDVLVRADEYREIVDPSPLVEVGLHRVLLAVLHRAVEGPESISAWLALWERGSLDAILIDRYLERLADRFDLFDARRPFYQERGLVAAGVRQRPVVRLTHELASEGNAALLFDHTLNVTFAPGRAARYLVAHQTFALGGLTTPPPGSADRSSVDAPSARAAHIRVRGRNLFETLLLNLVRYDPGVGVPVAGSGGPDVPAWERPAAAGGATRQPTGYLDVLTWQSRRVELVAAEPDGAVTDAAILSGDRVAPGRDLWAIEPVSLAFVPRRGRGDEPAALRELRLSKNRSFWRDSTALLATAGPTGRDGRRPGVLEWVADLLFFVHLDDRFVVPLEVVGVVADQAKTELWRREVVPLPADALRSSATVERLGEALRVAERVGSLLGDGDEVLDAGGHNLPRPLWRIGGQVLGTPERPARPDAIRGFVSGLGAARGYWASLGVAFERLVVDLGDAASGPNPDEGRARALERWDDTVAASARAAFRRATSGLGGAPRVLIAVADGENAFHLGLSRALGRARRQ